MRRERWRQENPRDQIVAILQSLEGDYRNIEEGIVEEETAVAARERINESFQEMRELVQMLPPGSCR